MSTQHYQQTHNEYLVSTNKALLNMEVIHHYLSTESYWAIDIPKTTVETCIENSMCFGVYNNNVQIGFARLITDKATFAYLADVFIITTEQGKGLGKFLIQTIMQHPQLQGLRRWYLTTRDAHSLYAQFNWQPINDDMKNRLMTINKPNIYTQNKVVV
jgi:N-acetylglutamate synthase-like GNAT family acetyltransferase